MSINLDRPRIKPREELGSNGQPLAKPRKPTKTFREKVKIRVGRPKKGSKEEELVAMEKKKRTTIVNRLMKYKHIDELPHEFLWRVSKGEQIKHGRTIIQPTWEDRIDAAKAAAPYFAPKLSTVEVIKNVTDDELLTIITSAATAAGISINVGGTNPQATIENSTGAVITPADGTSARNPYLLARRPEQSVSPANLSL